MTDDRKDEPDATDSDEAEASETVGSDDDIGTDDATDTAANNGGDADGGDNEKPATVSLAELLKDMEDSDDPPKRPTVRSSVYAPELARTFKQMAVPSWFEDAAKIQFEHDRYAKNIIETASMLPNIAQSIAGLNTLHDDMRGLIAQNLATPVYGLAQVMADLRANLELDSAIPKVAAEAIKQVTQWQNFQNDLIKQVALSAHQAVLAGFATKTQEWLTTTDALRYKSYLPVWHYTSGEALMSILRYDTLWASSSQQLNDSSEITHGYEILMKAWHNIKFDKSKKESFDPDDWKAIKTILFHVLDEEYVESIINEVYFISASSKDDLLTLWRNYARNNGFAIGIDTKVEISANGFDVAETEDIDGKQAEGSKHTIPPISGWYRVKYKPREKDRLAAGFIENAIDDIIHTHADDHDALTAELRKQAVILASVMKHEAFLDEREVRWISTNFTSFDPVQYEQGKKSIVPVLHIKTASESDVKPPLPLKGVRCSPIPNDHIVRTIEGLLRRRGYSEASTNVSKSTQPYVG